MANEYATSAELKTWLGIADTSDDASLAIALEAASRQIDELVGRRFYGEAQTRQFDPLNSTLIFVDDLTTVTTLKTDEDGDGVYEVTWATTDYVLEPANAGDWARPYSSVRVATDGRYAFPIGEETVEIAGTWGYAAVPAPIKQATIIQAARLFKRKDSPFGVAGGGEFGEVRAIPGGRDLGIDRDAEALIKPYRRLQLAGF